MNPRIPFRTLARPAVVAAALLLAGTAYVMAVDDGWPRVVDLPEGRIVVYEPQVESLQGNILKGRGALSLTPKGKKDPVFGAIWFESRIEIDRDARTVTVEEMKIPRVRFPNSTDEESARYAQIITREAGKWDMTLSLDRMIAGLSASRREQQEADQLNMQPPKILFETTPALLVVLDGDAKVVPVHDSPLERVVNTPYFMVRDKNDGTFYLNGVDMWFSAPAPAGPWKHVASVPDAVTQLYQESLAKPADEHAVQGAPKPPAKGAGNGRVPKIIVSTEPAELIVSDGKPQFSSLPGGELLAMNNTESDVLLDVASQKYYVLASGRWFRSGSMEGPWEFVRPDHLPEAFAKIPEGSDKGDVLAHVAGTPEAEEAVMDTAVPQTAAVKRSEARLKVDYDGAPQFRKITGTSVEYAVNTASEVLRIKGRYYACDQAVWFVADSPEGPWVVCDQVPEEVQEIPPESPVYNVKYVYVYDHTPDTVYVGYLPPYVGCYPYYGTVVWGTGWYYPGWWGTAYYPYPVTYGFHARYNSYYGWSFGFGFGWNWGPFYASFGWGYPGWWGPVGWVPPYYAYYPYYPYYSYYPRYSYPAPYYQHGTYYPGTTRVVRSEPPGSNQNLYRHGANRDRVRATKDKGYQPRAPVARGVPNNVYADPDGNIYRRTKNGWQTRDAHGWRSAPAAGGSGGGSTPGTTRRTTPPPPTARPAPGTPAPTTQGQSARPAPPPPQSPPDRDYRARQRGDYRVQQYRSSGGGRPAAPPPRGGGGSPHGGGGGGARPSSPPPRGGGGGGGHHGGGSPHGGGGHPHR
jgi:hypothetical protein